VQRGSESVHWAVNAYNELVNACNPLLYAYDGWVNAYVEALTAFNGRWTRAVRR
jgi:hypothetical protein